MEDLYGAYRQATGDTEIYSGDVIPTPPVPQNGIGAMMTAYSCNSIRRSAIVEQERIKNRSILTQKALGYTAALSVMEEKFTQVAPLGRERYRALIDSNTKAAYEQIGGFQVWKPQ